MLPIGRGPPLVDPPSPERKHRRVPRHRDPPPTSRLVTSTAASISSSVRAATTAATTTATITTTTTIQARQQHPGPSANTNKPSCHPERKWHASTTVAQLCTNDDVTLASWDRPALKGSYLFDTYLECCDVMFSGPNGCGRRDVCVDDIVILGEGNLGGTNGNSGGGVNGGGGGANNGGSSYYPAGHTCHSRMWHPSISSSSPTCTNTDGSSVPSYWNNPVMVGVTMFRDPDECCDKLRLSRGGLDCAVEEADDCVDGDVDADGGGGSVGGLGGDANQDDVSGGGFQSVRECEEGRRWHASKSRDGTCTNDDDHPPIWGEEYYLGQTMFFTHRECCASLNSFGLSTE